MSGECGYAGPHYAGRPSTGEFARSEEVAKLATATLSRLNSMMKQTSDWRDERLSLESSVWRLKSELKRLGKNPEEVLRPDPLVVHQRSEIRRLELTVNRLEAEVRGLREALLEADQAITCSGARRLKEKMARVRAEGAEARRKLEDEIGLLRVRAEEAEGESSCASLGRLRLKLREILKVDKKMELMIADVATRGCDAVIELSNELTRIKDLLDDSRLQNITLKAALESRAFDLEPRSSGHLETIEQLEGRIKELEETLGGNRKEFETQEAVVTALRNEVIGAKTAWKIQSEELAGLRESKVEVERLKEAMKSREDLVADLEERVRLSVSSSRDVERLGDELKTVKARLLNIEIERDGLLDEIDKMGAIVSERNDQIVKILEEVEVRRSEIDGVKTRLSVARAENERLKARCCDMENELSKSNGTGKSSGDQNAPFVERIKELEERLSSTVRDPNLEVKTRRCQVRAVQTSKFTLEENQGILEHLRTLRSENNALKDELNSLTKRNSENQKLDIGTATESKQPKDEETQANDDAEEKVQSSLKKLSTERDALKIEYKKLVSENRGLNLDLEVLKSKMEELTSTNESLIEDLNGFQGLREKLQAIEEELSLRVEKESMEYDLRVENEELKTTLKEERRGRSEAELSVEKLRGELENYRSRLAEDKKKMEEIVKSREKLEEVEGSVMNSGDYVRADRELKYYIHLQSLAVKRVVDFISYVVGAGEPAGRRPAMAKFLEPTADNLMALNFDENITATFRMSHKLSQKIFHAEIEVQKLETLKNELKFLRDERDGLNQGVERLSKMLKELGQEISMPRNFRPAQDDFLSFGNGGEVCGENYHPCFLAGSKNQITYHKNLDNEEFENLSLAAMPARISILEMRIKLKQENAAVKLIEMRETMRQERIRLMEIADRTGNLPNSEELAEDS